MMSRKLFAKFCFFLSLMAVWVMGNAAMAQDPRPLTLWVAQDANSLVAKHALFLRKQIEERLPGQFDISLKTAPLTPREGKMLAHVQKGELDLVLLSDAVIDAVPELSLFRIPWLFQSHAHAQEALYAGLEDEIRSAIDRELKVVALGVYDNVFHHIRARIPMTTPKAFKGRRILVNSGTKAERMFRSLGARPQKYPLQRAETALNNGIADSFSGSLQDLNFLKIGSHQVPTLTLSHHLFEPVFFLASQKFWSGLSNAQRGVFTELAVDFSDTAHLLAMTRAANARQNIPKTLRVTEIDVEKFEGLIAKRRKAYISTYGSDWLDYVDLALEQTATD